MSYLFLITILEHDYPLDVPEWSSNFLGLSDVVSSRVGPHTQAQFQILSSYLLFMGKKKGVCMRTASSSLLMLSNSVYARTVSVFVLLPCSLTR